MCGCVCVCVCDCVVVLDRTCENINKSSTSDKEDQRGNAKMVNTCQEKGRRARSKKNGRCTSSTKETDRKKIRWKFSCKRYVESG